VNYRHAFHAGNFADVLKHAALVRVLLHLCGKETPFRVIDTHAGIGRYDLLAGEATRTQEWRGGIGRLLNEPLGGEAGELLAPYLALVRATNEGAALTRYPGSPAIAQALCRPQDRMMFCELHPEDHATLRRNVGRDPRVKIAGVDGWTGLKAYLPPKERRGLVLIDPAFEEPGEFDRLANGMGEAYRRWATGIYLLWYPVKAGGDVRAFEQRMAALHIPKILRAELSVGAHPQKPEALHACGLMVVNPPWPLENELKIVLPALVRSLSANGGGHSRLDWIAR
jgi:23S rRNA (adenine2030-N6)-methyltransferase